MQSRSLFHCSLLCYRTALAPISEQWDLILGRRISLGSTNNFLWTILRVTLLWGLIMDKWSLTLFSYLARSCSSEVERRPASLKNGICEFKPCWVMGFIFFFPELRKWTSCPLWFASMVPSGEQSPAVVIPTKDSLPLWEEPGDEHYTTMRKCSIAVNVYCHRL